MNGFQMNQVPEKKWIASLGAGLLALCALALPARAGHYNDVKFHIRLVSPDSLTLAVNADDDDNFNAMGVFPDKDNVPQIVAYQKKLEGYLLSRITVTADKKRLYLKAVQWKPGGKGPDDNLDSNSLYNPRQIITFGARLPKGTRSLGVSSNLWTEFDHATLAEVELAWDKTVVDRRWTLMEKTLRFPIEPDSLAAMKKRAGSLPPPARPMPDPDGE